jgi:hypothetical protein
MRPLYALVADRKVVGKKLSKRLQRWPLEEIAWGRTAIEGEVRDGGMKRINALLVVHAMSFAGRDEVR